MAQVFPLLMYNPLAGKELLGAMAFPSHAPKRSSASKMEGYPQNSGEIAQIVCRQHVGSMHVQRSDPEKD